MTDETTEPAPSVEQAPPAASTGPSLGARIAKVAAIVVGLALAVVFLFTVVFPRVERYFEDPTFDAGAVVPAVTWVATDG